MQNNMQRREPGWGDLGLWARYTAFHAGQGTGKRIAAWFLLAVYSAFVFGLPPLIWFTWHEWDFCRAAHIWACILPVYWIYLAVKARQRHEDGEPVLQASDGEVARSSERFRAWRTRLYERPIEAKIGDVVARLVFLGVLALIFRARFWDNGYFNLLCGELAFRTLLMIKRPSRLSSPAMIEPA